MIGDAAELQAVCECLVVGQRLGGRAPVHICKRNTLNVGKQDTCSSIVLETFTSPCVDFSTAQDHTSTLCIRTCAHTRAQHGTFQHLWPQHAVTLKADDPQTATAGSTSSVPNCTFASMGIFYTRFNNSISLLNEQSGMNMSHLA